jgi:signal transduction histidine kinase/ligand-binding sensor domain-containing protein/DNA-binding response OmpR family regulator
MNEFPNLHVSTLLMRQSAFIIFIFLTFYSNTTAQQPLYSHYKVFKVEDGLPQSFISGLAQDVDGFLWISTRDGLARYDGREFKIFRQNPNDSLSLSSNIITDLFLDAQNLLWVFYVNEKVDCFDPRRMQVCFKDSFSSVRQLLAELKIKKFYRDRLGRFWFNSSNKGVVCFDPQHNKTTWFDTARKNLRSNNNLAVAEDMKGRIYVFTDKGIEWLPMHTNETAIFTPFDPALRFRFIPGANYIALSLADGRIALTERKRLIVFDPVKKTFSSYELPAHVPVKQDIIQHLQMGRDGLLYLAAAGGIYRFEKNHQFTWLWQTESSNLFAGDARSFLIDHSSVMWFGTNAAGIYKINLQALPFRSVPYKINFITDVLSGFLGNPDAFPASLKQGKWAYGLRYSYGEGNKLLFTYSDKLMQLEKLSIYSIHENTLSTLPAPPGEHAAIAGLSIAPSGILYGMDLRGNIWKWKDIHSQPALIPSSLNLLSTTTVVDMETDDGIFWASTNKEGLFKIENNKVVHHFTHKPQKNGWPSDQLTDLCKDPVNKEILWVGTLGHGLIRLNKTNNSLKVYTTEDGLPNNTVYSIAPDSHGNLWISTNKGISRFTPATNTFYNFDVKDGLIGNEFNRFHHLQLPDGRIAMGGPEGYSLFDPAKFVKDTFTTTVALTRLLINNKPVEYTGSADGLPEPLNQLQQLVLPHNNNFLQFEFAGMQFNQPEKIHYRHMLKGYDKEWIVSGQYNIAGYTRLPPGRYTLLLNASNSTGYWSPEVRQLSIRIRPPFWATWWAYSMYALAALLLVRMYWRYRTNRIKMQHEIALEQSKAQHLKEVDEIKTRFFSNITHELRTPLTLILTPLEKLKEENHYSPADQRILSNAHKNAEQLLRLINQLLDISKIESKQMKVNLNVGEMAEFAERCVQQFSIQARNRNIQLRISNKNVAGHFLFDEEKWEKIIFNLLSNAIKFTPEGGEVTVTLEMTDMTATMRLSVADTGTGIREDDLPKIFDRFYMTDDSATRSHGGTGIGLSLVKELVELMKGKIEVKSDYGKGSSFIVEIPMNKVISKISQEVKPVEKIITAGEKPATTSVPEKTEGPLVLIAEDNDELRSFMAESLSPDWRILQAPDGKQAWDIILQELPDIVISDVMMPGMNGYELCQKVKDDARTGHISFFLLTAKAAHESRLAGLKKGADAYLTKPFHFDELEQCLHNLAAQQNRLRIHLQKELFPETPLRKLPHINDIFIRELYKQLDERIDDPKMSVETLARSVAMSQRTLNRKLKAILNLAPVEFIRQYRLQKAALLLSSGQGITDTAYSVGFETASYFTQCFKEQFGKTPTEFASQKTA